MPPRPPGAVAPDVGRESWPEHRRAGPQRNLSIYIYTDIDVDIDTDLDINVGADKYLDLEIDVDM